MLKDRNKNRRDAVEFYICKIVRTVSHRKESVSVSRRSRARSPLSNENGAESPRSLEMRRRIENVASKMIVQGRLAADSVKRFIVMRSYGARSSVEERKSQRRVTTHARSRADSPCGARLCDIAKTPRRSRISLSLALALAQRSTLNAPFAIPREVVT